MNCKQAKVNKVFQITKFSHCQCRYNINAVTRNLFLWNVIVKYVYQYCGMVIAKWLFLGNFSFILQVFQSRKYRKLPVISWYEFEDKDVPVFSPPITTTPFPSGEVTIAVFFNLVGNLGPEISTLSITKTICKYFEYYCMIKNLVSIVANKPIPEVPQNWKHWRLRQRLGKYNVLGDQTCHKRGPIQLYSKTALP